MKQMKRISLWIGPVCTCAALTAYSGRAESYSWTHAGWLDDITDAAFTNGTNWSGGTAPSALDPQAEIDMNFASSGDQSYYTYQRIVLPHGGVTNKAISGSMPRQWLEFSGRSPDGDRGNVLLRFDRPDGYEGLWSVLAKGSSGFAFVNEGGDAVPELKYVENGNRTVVRTETAQTRVTVGSWTGGGLFVKDGPGELILKNASGLQSACELRGGVLTLGRSDAEVPQSFPEGAVFHLDAQASETLKLSDDGKTVTAWSDLTDAGRVFGEETSVGLYGQPRLVEKDGRPFVDFGAQYGRSPKEGEGMKCLSSAKQREELGDAAMLTLPSDKGVSVRELFVVAEVTTDSGCPVSFGGHEGVYCWRVGSKGYLAPPGYGGAELMDDKAATGRWIVDGVEKKWNNQAVRGAVRVYSLKVPETAKFSCLGGFFQFEGQGGITNTGSFGGIRIGEILAYDRDLTDKERNGIHRLLMDKWHVGSERVLWDLGTLALRAASPASINVESGRTARVRHVYGPAFWDSAAQAAVEQKILKTGPGRLIVEDIWPVGEYFNVPIVVAGGSVAFTSTAARETVVSNKPAPGAFLHLDATKLDVSEGSAVSEWKDCNGGTAAMKTMAGRSDPVLASVATDGNSTRRIVDFGEERTTGGAAMELTGGDDAAFYDVFAVFRCRTEGKGAPVFSTKSEWIFVQTGTSLFNMENADSQARGALYAKNGRHVFGDADGTLDDELNVYSVSFDGHAQKVNALANWQDSGGGCQIGEYLCYDRRLTDNERRNTIAYLMAKWGMGAHPDTAVREIKEIVFTNGVPPCVGTDSPRTVKKIKFVAREGGPERAVLTKEGAGTLIVEAMENIDSIALAGGSLSCSQDVRLTDIAISASQFEPGAPLVLQTGGTLSFAPKGVIHVEVPADMKYGRWKIASARDIEDAANLAGWTAKAVPEAPGGTIPNGTFKLSVRGNDLYLRFVQPGFLIRMR